MLRIEKVNFNQVIEAAVKAYKRSVYNENCFSTREIKREISASNELSRLCCRLEELNVDFETFIAPICRKYDILVNEDYDVKSVRTKIFPSSLKLEINCKTLEYLFCEEDRHLIVEGYEPAINEKYFVQVQYDARFAYQQWDMTDEAIKELKKVKKFNDVLKTTNSFILNKKLTKIGIMRDLFSNDKIDCSSILLKYEDKDGELFICGAIGGFYEDIVIADKIRIIDVFPLNNKIEGYMCRSLKREAEVKTTCSDYVSKNAVIKHSKVLEFISMMKEYENILLTLA